MFLVSFYSLLRDLIMDYDQLRIMEDPVAWADIAFHISADRIFV